MYSLFLGVSVLSFIEVLYFFTVRLYKHYRDANIREKRRQEMTENGVLAVKKKKIKYGEAFHVGGDNGEEKQRSGTVGIHQIKEKATGTTDSGKTIIMGGFMR